MFPKSISASTYKVKPIKSDKKWQKLSIMPRRIPLSEQEDITEGGDNQGGNQGGCTTGGELEG